MSRDSSVGIVTIWTSQEFWLDSRHGQRIYFLSLFQSLAVPWLRRLVAGLLPQRPGFGSGSVHVGFVVDQVALGQVFPQSTSVSPCQFHSTGAPLQGKAKKKNNLHHRVAQQASRLRCVRSTAAGPFTTNKNSVFTE
jgi:hypothetical protein